MPHIAPWFPAAKFGVFIHWVLKSVWMDNPQMDTAGPTGDWRDTAPDLAKQFTAEAYDPREWAKLFKSWGARYAVLTTKHHIGFALFDEPGAKFSAANSSPAGRDLVGPYVEALRAEGLKVGLYYSLPDWSHPEFASCAGGDDRRKYSEVDQPERWERFLEQMFAEVRHLCTAYGQIDLLWFDGDWERTAEQWRSVELAKMIEKLQPHIVINNRLRHPCIGHYGTPESNAPLAPKGGVWEFCTTPGDNWDGPPANENLKPPSELIRIFGDTLGMGGNLLLNVAPTREGEIPAPQQEVLRGLGRWIAEHAEAIYGAEAGLPAGLFNGASTRRGSVVYLISYDRPADELVVKGLQSDVRRVTHLTTGTELSWRRSGGRAKFGQAGWLFVTVPPELHDPHATVLKVEFADDVARIAVPAGGTLTWKGRPSFEEQDLAASR